MLMKIHLIFNICVRKKISKKTKVIIPVHLFGQVSNMSELLKLKSNYNFKIIEDNAQSFGSYIYLIIRK